MINIIFDKQLSCSFKVARAPLRLPLLGSLKQMKTIYTLVVFQH